MLKHPGNEHLRGLLAWRGAECFHLPVHTIQITFTPSHCGVFRETRQTVCLFRWCILFCLLHTECYLKWKSFSLLTSYLLNILYGLLVAPLSVWRQCNADGSECRLWYMKERTQSSYAQVHTFTSQFGVCMEDFSENLRHEGFRFRFMEAFSFMKIFSSTKYALP